MHTSVGTNRWVHMFSKTSNLSVAVAKRACTMILQSTALHLDTCATPSVSTTREHWKLFVGRSEAQLRAMDMIYSTNDATILYCTVVAIHFRSNATNQGQHA